MDDHAPPAFVADDRGAEAGRGQRRNAIRLWTLVAAAVVLPLAILVAGSWGAWRLTWNETRQDLTRAVEANADFVRITFRLLVRVTSRVADATSVLGRRPLTGEELGVNERLALILSDQPLVRGVVVLDEAGGEVLRIDTLPGGVPGPPGGGILEALAQTRPGAIAIGEVYRGSPDLVFAIGLRRPSQNGSVILLLDSVKLGEALARHLEKPTDSAALLRADGHILARFPSMTEPLPVLSPQRPMMRALARGETRGLVSGVTPRNEQAVAVAFQALDIPGLVVAAGRPQGAIVGAWHQVMLPLLGVGLPAVIALVGLVLVVRRQQDALETTLEGLEQRIAERTESLREGEERLRLAVQAGQFGTWETDLASGLSTRSARTLEIWGLRPEAAVSPMHDWLDRVHPADQPRLKQVWTDTMSGRVPAFREEYRFLHYSGNWLWLESHGAVVRNDPLTGEALRMAGTMQDITERREAEERRELLTQEVNHRARNTLAIVQAILRLTRAASVDDYARLIEGRIAALARAQALLAAERWSGAPLMAILLDELAPFGGTGSPAKSGEGRFTLSGPPFRVRADAVQPLGMVFHELVTNAVKHGALSIPQGHIAISWWIDEAAGVMHIRWQETNGPAPGFPARRGVGTRVIEATVAGQLGGSVERRWPKEGLVCDIVVPLSRARLEAG